MGSLKVRQANPQEASITAALAMITDGAMVSASDNLVPRLTSRATVTPFALRALSHVKPEWIIVDPDSTRHFVVTRATELIRLETAERSGCSIRFQGQGITLMRTN